MRGLRIDICASHSLRRLQVQHRCAVDSIQIMYAQDIPLNSYEIHNCYTNGIGAHRTAQGKNPTTWATRIASGVLQQIEALRTMKIKHHHYLSTWLQPRQAFHKVRVEDDARLNLPDPLRGCRLVELVFDETNGVIGNCCCGHIIFYTTALYTNSIALRGHAWTHKPQPKHMVGSGSGISNGSS